MEKLHKKIIRDVSTSPPVFTYNNSISYEITVDTEYITVNYDKNGTIGIDSKINFDITTDFISDLIKVLDRMLTNELSSNKSAWFDYMYNYEKRF